MSFLDCRFKCPFTELPWAGDDERSKQYITAQTCPFHRPLDSWNSSDNEYVDKINILMNSQQRSPPSQNMNFHGASFPPDFKVRSFQICQFSFCSGKNFLCEAQFIYFDHFSGSATLVPSFVVNVTGQIKGDLRIAKPEAAPMISVDFLGARVSGHVGISSESRRVMSSLRGNPNSLENNHSTAIAPEMTMNIQGKRHGAAHIIQPGDNVLSLSISNTNLGSISIRAEKHLNIRTSNSCLHGNCELLLHEVESGELSFFRTDILFLIVSGPENRSSLSLKCERGVRFRNLSLTNAENLEHMDFTGAIFFKAPNINSTTPKRSRFPENMFFHDLSVESIEKYRHLKTIAMQGGHFEDARTFFLLEQRALRKSGKITLSQRFVSLCGDILSEYNNSIFRPAILYVFWIFVFAFIYAGIVDPSFSEPHFSNYAVLSFHQSFRSFELCSVDLTAEKIGGAFFDEKIIILREDVSKVRIVAGIQSAINLLLFGAIALSAREFFKARADG